MTSDSYDVTTDSDDANEPDSDRKSGQFFHGRAGEEREVWNQGFRRNHAGLYCMYMYVCLFV